MHALLGTPKYAGQLHASLTFGPIVIPIFERATMQLLWVAAAGEAVANGAATSAAVRARPVTILLVFGRMVEISLYESCNLTCASLCSIGSWRRRLRKPSRGMAGILAGIFRTVFSACELRSEGVEQRRCRMSLIL